MQNEFLTKTLAHLDDEGWREAFDETWEDRVDVFNFLNTLSPTENAAWMLYCLRRHVADEVFPSGWTDGWYVSEFYGRWKIVDGKMGLSVLLGTTSAMCPDKESAEALLNEFLDTIREGVRS